MIVGEILEGINLELDANLGPVGGSNLCIAAFPHRLVDPQAGREAIGIARFRQELLRPFRVVPVSLLDLFGPLFEGDVEPLHADHPLRGRIGLTLEVRFRNGLEVQRHLHGLAYPKVIEGRLAYVGSKGLIRPKPLLVQHNVGVGLAKACRRIERIDRSP